MEKEQVDWSYFLFVPVGILLAGILLLGCNGRPVPPAPQATEAPIVAPTPTPVEVGVVQTDFKVRRELPVVWAGPGDVGELPQLDHDDWEGLLAGGLVTTDDDGEGWVKISDCMLIYIFQSSGLVKAACPKSDRTGGNVTCADAGTSVFNNSCASQIIQTPSAEILLEGTWLSVTYLPERQLTLVIVFEGAAKVQPVRNFDARILGKPVDVVEGHFWFTTPGVRADPIAGLAAREPHPFDQLLPVVEELDLWPWIDRIKVRADADNVPFPEFLTPTPTRTPTPKPAVQMRLKVTSTSDWTSVTLPSVGVIAQKRTVDTRGITTFAFMEDRTIQLGQLLERAEAGHAVEIVQDITLAELAEDQKLRFKIERGCLGETVVEVFNVVTDTPTLVARLVVDVCEPRFFSVDARALVPKGPPTSTPTQTLTRRPPARTPTPIRTPTPRPLTGTPTPTRTPTSRPPTGMPTPTRTPTSRLPTSTPTPTWTPTPRPPTSTPTPTLTPTPVTVRVPNVVGLLLEQAVEVLAANGLQVGKVREEPVCDQERGKVIDQSPDADTEVTPGTSVDLVIAVPPETVVVPNVVGLLREQAVEVLAAACLQVGQVVEVPVADYEPGKVIDQSPGANTEVAPGTPVDLWVAVPPQPTPTPAPGVLL